MLAIWLEFIAKLAWPVVTLIGFALFAKDIKTLLNRLERAKLGSLELHTEEKVKRVLEKAVDVSGELEFIPEKTLALPGTPARNTLLSGSESADRDRYTAIVNVRNELHARLRDLAVKNEIVEKCNSTKAPLPWLLQRLRIAMPDFIKQLDTIGQILNTAEEILRSPDISETAIAQFLDASKLLLIVLNQKIT